MGSPVEYKAVDVILSLVSLSPACNVRRHCRAQFIFRNFWNTDEPAALNEFCATIALPRNALVVRPVNSELRKDEQ